MSGDMQPGPQTSRFQRAARFFFFRFLPALLVLGIIWTGYRVLDVFWTRYQNAGQAEDRQELYALTATALSPDLRSEALADDGVRLIAQFATNTPVGGSADATPDAPQPTTASGSFGLVTNTPLAPDPAAGEVPIATPLPSEDLPQAYDPANRTPVALPTFLPPDDPQIAEASGTAVPTQVPLIERSHELINIMLLGTDNEVAGDNMIRTDTMIVLSINTETGTVSMLSFPRDLFVYIPSGTMQRMNTTYGIGEQIGWTDGGFGLLRQTIFYNFGINVHYYALVNFSGFEQIIDMLGGVDIAVDCAYQDYYPVDDFDPARPLEENYYLRTLDVGYYAMNGFDALWYARTRKNTSDFDRGRRQQQLLRAIWRKGRDTGQLSALPSLWDQMTQIVETNLPFETMLGLMPIALNLDAGRIETFTMTRTYHTTPWQPPDGTFVQVPNYEPIQQLLQDFYTPPSQSEIDLAGPSIAVYNGTSNPDWDRVAAERLIVEGFSAYAAGPADPGDYPVSTLIDETGQEKGSLVGDVIDVLNISIDNVQRQPSADRVADYTVILGADYNSCTFAVLPIESQ